MRGGRSRMCCKDDSTGQAGPVSRRSVAPGRATPVAPVGWRTLRRVAGKACTVPRIVRVFALGLGTVVAVAAGGQSTGPTTTPPSPTPSTAPPAAAAPPAALPPSVAPPVAPRGDTGAAGQTPARTGEVWHINDMSQSTLVYARDGSLIGELGHELRTSVPLSSLPAYVPEAFIAIEDRRFYQHNGVDVIGVIGALKDRVIGRRMRGASTITQQLV